jgi:hypothetical protein
MRYIIALSVLGCLAASPAFAWGTGAGTGAGASIGGNNGSTGDHGEADARGNLGNGPLGPVDGIEGTLTRCNK